MQPDGWGDVVGSPTRARCQHLPASGVVRSEVVGILRGGWVLARKCPFLWVFSIIYKTLFSLRPYDQSA